MNIPKRVLCIILLFLPGILPCHSQKFLMYESYNADSLLKVFPGQVAGERVNTLNKLAVSLSFVDQNLSLRYADTALALARDVNFREGMADAYRNYGHVYLYIGQYPKALVNFFEALAIYQEPDNKQKVFMTYFFIAKTHYFANNYQKAIEIGKIALEKCQERLPDGSTVGSIQDVVNFKICIAQTLTESGSVEESLEMRRDCLEIMKANHFSDIQILVTTWVIGADHYGLGNNDSAKVYFYKALSLPGEDMNTQAQKYRAIMWLADLLDREGDKDTAVSYMQRALRWYDENGALVWALCASNTLGEFYYRANDYTRAENSFRESEKFFAEMLSGKSYFRPGAPKDVAFYGFELYSPVPPKTLKELMWNWGTLMYDYLYLIAEKQNRTKEALKYHILYADAYDTLRSIWRNKETVEFQIRYESDQKERQIRDLSEENAFKSYKLRQSRIFLFGLAGLITLVILLAIALIRQGRLREKQNSMILQQKLFRSQMNPHFIFNSLSSIHHFMIDEKPAKAASYLSKFSKLIRNILQGSTEEYTSLSNEIGIIENYLELQKLRFPGKFEYKIEVDDALDPDHMSIPSMITQPFVENAIEHGIRHKGKKGKVFVSFNSDEDIITIVVEDDGIGREKARQLQGERDKDHHSLATTLIMDRIRALNRASKKKITLNIADLHDDLGEAAGTRVVLEVPLR